MADNVALDGCWMIVSKARHEVGGVTTVEDEEAGENLRCNLLMLLKTQTVIRWVYSMPFVPIQCHCHFFSKHLLLYKTEAAASFGNLCTPVDVIIPSSAAVQWRWMAAAAKFTFRRRPEKELELLAT